MGDSGILKLVMTRPSSVRGDGGTFRSRSGRRLATLISTRMSTVRMYVAVNYQLWTDHRRCG
jgi:hypothetical protein